MKGKIRYFPILILAIVSISYIYYNLKSNKKLVLAKYLMFSCEKCNHMEVIESDDKSLISETIIPESANYVIEDLISVSLKNKQNFCLEGYAYIFNLSTLWIDPPGIRFKVDKSYPLSECQKLYNRVRAGFSPALPTPPCMRVRTGRFISHLDNGTSPTVL